MLLSAGALAILGACGWLLWDHKADGPGYLLAAGAMLIAIGSGFGI